MIFHPDRVQHYQKKTKEKPIYSVIGGSRMKKAMEFFGMKSNDNDSNNDNIEQIDKIRFMW